MSASRLLLCTNVQTDAKVHNFFGQPKSIICDITTLHSSICNLQANGNLKKRKTISTF